MEMLAREYCYGGQFTFSTQLIKPDYFQYILGRSGATNRDDATFSGESLLILTEPVPKWSNSVLLMGQKNIFVSNQRRDLAG